MTDPVRLPIRARFAVRVNLPKSGWTFQPCLTLSEAIEVFDAIRELRPWLEVQRLTDGRVAELSGQYASTQRAQAASGRAASDSAAQGSFA